MPSDVINDVIGIWHLVSVVRTFYLLIKNFMTTRMGRLTLDVFLFSVVAFATLDISQDSVATHLRCGMIFSDSIMTNFS